MKFDIFLSICQTEVDGFLPSEKHMWQSFFDQVKLADQMNFGTAWVAETHLSCQVQKQNKDAVIPHFKGEIGLNTDILQVAHKVFSQTKKINIGSAIRNIICNGGPLAHAEAIRTFLALHDLDPTENRKLEIGFAAGRFPFSNTPYGFYPKTDLEKSAWDVIKNKYFIQATEIFLRFIKGEKLSSADLRTVYLEQKDFRDPAQWQKVQEITRSKDKISLSPHWEFPMVGVIPTDVSLRNLKLTIGSHDPEAQILANEFLPTGVFNLSITPPEVIEQTHARMRTHYHSSGGAWKRELMPRTVLLYIDEDRKKAKALAETAWKNYWTAMEKTLDPKKVEGAVANTIAGDSVEVLDLIRQKYNPEDRLMLWFDFNLHDNEFIKKSMRHFMDKVATKLN